jgi:hypothetical protein
VTSSASRASRSRTGPNPPPRDQLVPPLKRLPLAKPAALA